MNCYPEDEEDRDRQRRQRREAHLVVELCKKKEFDSFKQQECPRQIGLCFGSRTSREVLPVKESYWNPKFSLYASPPRPIVKPESSIVVPTTVPRFAETAYLTQVPAPNFYKLPQPRTNVWDFSKDLPRPEIVSVNSNPGIGTYKLSKSSFGQSDQKLVACKTICTPYHESICENCNELTIGDFYYSSYSKVSYCRTCFQQRLKDVQNNTRILSRTRAQENLKQFRKVRNCQFFHKHLNTERAVTRLGVSQRSLNQKFKLENYLCRF